MQLVLKMKLDNAAFVDAPHSGDEIARILHKLASNWRGVSAVKGDGGQLIDANGNTVGHWRVTR